MVSDSPTTLLQTAKCLKKWYNTSFDEKWLKHDKLKIRMEKMQKVKFNVVSTVFDITLKNPNRSALLACGKSIKQKQSLKTKSNTLYRIALATKKSNS